MSMSCFLQLRQGVLRIMHWPGHHCYCISETNQKFPYWNWSFSWLDQGNLIQELDLKFCIINLFQVTECSQVGRAT